MVQLKCKICEFHELFSRNIPHAFVLGYSVETALEVAEWFKTDNLVWNYFCSVAKYAFILDWGSNFNNVLTQLLCTILGENTFSANKLSNLKVSSFIKLGCLPQIEHIMFYGHGLFYLIYNYGQMGDQPGIRTSGLQSLFPTLQLRSSLLLVQHFQKNNFI